MKGFLLAAGLGERLRPLTLQRAKPSLPFLNVPMLAYNLFCFEQLGLTELVVNTHHAPESIARCFDLMTRANYSVNVVHEEELLGSGGGIGNVRQLLSGDKNFIVGNADSILLPGTATALEDFYRQHCAHDPIATIYTCPLAGIGVEIPAVWVGEGNQVLGFGKTPPAKGCKPWHYASLIVFSERIFKFIPPGASNILYDNLVAAMKAGEKVEAFCDLKALWFETGNPNAYLAATQQCLQLLSQNINASLHLKKVLGRFSPGWNQYSNGNVHAHDKENYKQAQSLEFGLVGKSVKVSKGTKLSGWVVIGDDTKISENCSIENCVIGDHVELAAGEHICDRLKL